MTDVKLWGWGVLLSFLMVWAVGCEMPWDSDDKDPEGTSTIQGNVQDFVATPRSARAVKGGIEVSLQGPVKRKTTTGENGTFVFSGLPEGTYKLTLTYNGEKISLMSGGADLEINLRPDQRVELINIRISGGVVTVGSIRVVPLTPSPKSGTNSGDDGEADTGSSPSARGTVSMTVNVKRK